MLRPFISHDSVNNCFEIDGLLESDLLKALPTPLFVTSLSACRERALSYQQNMQQHFEKSIVYYAVKANSSLAILELFKGLGLGFDLVSAGELRRVQKTGISAHHLCFAGVGKTHSEINFALQAGVGLINVEHILELDSLLEMLSGETFSGCSTHLALRLNPCIEAKTHPHLVTGALGSKFGILSEHVISYLADIKSQRPDKFRAGLKRIKGMHVHIGSQLSSPDIYDKVVIEVFKFCESLIGLGFQIQHLDMGGGLEVGLNGIPADHSDIKERIAAVATSLKRQISLFPQCAHLFGNNLQNVTVSVEPGRSLVASSTVLLSKVLYLKTNGPLHNFAIVDAGMNDFPRPSLYQAVHQIELSRQVRTDNAALCMDQDRKSYTVCGPVCESGDVFAKNVSLPCLVEGDILGFFEAGAYTQSMSSHYNLRDTAACAFVDKGKIVSSQLPIQVS